MFWFPAFTVTESILESTVALTTMLTPSAAKVIAAAVSANMEDLNIMALPPWVKERRSYCRPKSPCRTA